MLALSVSPRARGALAAITLAFPVYAVLPTFFAIPPVLSVSAHFLIFGVRVPLPTSFE